VVRQESFADEKFEKFRKVTRKEQFLDEMETIIPWKSLAVVIEPFYPNPERTARPPIGIDRTLLTHFTQHWCGLSDPAEEEGLYDSRALPPFVGIDLDREVVQTKPRSANFLT